MPNKNQIEEYRENVQDIMEDEQVFSDLAKNTFSGLLDKDKSLIPQALMEGQMKGFDIKDFMKGNVYALPFYNKSKGGYEYSLTVSIDYMRKIAARSGLSGKSEPQYSYKDNGDVEACKVTVWKDGGHEKGYTAKVFFDEYTTKRNLWKSKPMTMIAKVAEMHALRMAFPEELQNHYTEEELEKDMTTVEGQVVEQEVDIDKYEDKIKECESLQQLKGVWSAMPIEAKDELEELKDDKKKELTQDNKDQDEN